MNKLKPKELKAMPRIIVVPKILKIGNVIRPKWYQFWLHKRWNICERYVMERTTPRVTLYPKPKRR